MADTDSVMQLGVEAARAGDKEEARNLFRLLTREKPNDAQAWLWLAGVAEDRQEKRAALEQVLQLDPSNTLARESLESMGVTPAVPAIAPLTTPEPAGFGFDDDPFDVPELAQPTPPPVSQPAPQTTCELSPDEEFAMSLDSFGSMTTSYGAQERAGSDVDFAVPDFGMGDDEDFDMQAYMNRERVDPSAIEVTQEEIKTPKRKPISGTISSEDAKKLKSKRPVGSSGLRPLLIIGVAAVLILAGALWWINRQNNQPTAGVTNPTTDPALGIDASPVITDTISGIETPVIPGIEAPGEIPGGEVPTLEPPTAEPAPPAPNFPTDSELGNVQPTLLAAGVQPINVDNWFFNYAGISGIADGNEIGIQPQGRWVTVGLLLFDGTAEGRPIPEELVVLKDAQGRVYRANAAASEAYLNRYPGSFTNHLNQNALIGVNFDVPYMFDVAPDATDLVLFSPQETSLGYYVRQSPF